jgi:hypothetical protein
LNADPHELVNLYGRNEHQARRLDLHARLCQWQERTGDVAVLPAV